MCRCLRVSASDHCGWGQRPLRARQLDNQCMLSWIRESHDDSRARIR